MIAHLIDVQRGVVGLAMAHLEPGGMPRAFGSGGGGASIVQESTTVAVPVVLGWLVVWWASGRGAWPHAMRDGSAALARRLQRWLADPVGTDWLSWRTRLQ